MPLILDHSAITAARLLTEIREVKGCYEKITRHLDAMVRVLLSLDNDQLAAFGNFLGPQEMNDLLTAHAAQGSGANSLAEMAEMVIAKAEQRAPGAVRKADIRPLADKLAEQYRAIQFDGAVFAVVDLPRPPEPEPPPVGDPVPEA